MTQRTIESINPRGLGASATPSDWFTEDSVKDPDLNGIGFRPVGYRILVRPLNVRPRTKAGLYLPEQSIEAQELLMTVGKLLAVGPVAWCRDDMTDENGKRVVWAKPGDYVVYGKYAGAKLLINGVKCLALNDDEIIAVVDKPEALLTIK